MNFLQPYTEIENSEYDRNENVKAVSLSRDFIGNRNPLGNTIDKMTILRQSNVDFVPIGMNRMIRTTPLIEDTTLNYKEAYAEAAAIYLLNPLAFSATSLIADSVADARVIVEEKNGSIWEEHTENPLAYWIDELEPNNSMDIYELLRAYVTHFHTFGKTHIVMFQKDEILPNGKLNTRNNCFDLIYPGRLAEDTVNNPYGSNWYFNPVHTDEIYPINSKGHFMDVWYNPIAHSTGVALPMNPLRDTFVLYKLYINQIKRFFYGDATPSGILTRLVDQNKEAMANSIDDAQIDHAVQRIYAQVGRGGKTPNGILGLRGDWRFQAMGSKLPELVVSELFQLMQADVSGVYKIPSSLFWAGMVAGGQRASRAQDSIDFFAQKVEPLQTRIIKRLGKFLVPLFIQNTKGKFRLNFDRSEMALAQYARNKDAAMYERWWKETIIPRRTILNYLNESTQGFTEEELNSLYSAGNNQGLNEASPRQLESMNGNV